MLFNSYVFIFIFFPLCISGFYLLAPRKDGLWAKLWLIGFSLWFYGYFNLGYLAIMLGSIGVNYIFHRLLSDLDTKRCISSKGILTIGVILNLAVLGYFKYTDFLIGMVNQVFASEFRLLGILLPLGISFFTFQQISFLVDTYRGEVRNCPFPDYALFVSFFPQLIAGPIVNHEEMLPQFAAISTKKVNAEQLMRGFTLFVLGLGKKVLIADTLGAPVDFAYVDIGTMTGLDCFLVMIWYTLQLYFDFSGYCDMARGLGRMLGIEITVNFDSPYKSADIAEFWKRWHITLNRFFTKYVYIPLGGSRKGEARLYVNLLIVFFLSGLWHGAGYNFLVWGMLHGILMVLTRAYRIHGGEKCKLPKLLAVGGTFLYTAFAWIFFRAPNLTTALTFVKTMFTAGFAKVNFQMAGELKPDELWYVLKVLHLTDSYYSQYILMIVLTIAALATVFGARNASDVADHVKPKWYSMILISGIFAWCILALSEVSTFLYFNF